MKTDIWYGESFAADACGSAMENFLNPLYTEGTMKLFIDYRNSLF